jgi:hypothetical protein
MGLGWPAVLYGSLIANYILYSYLKYCDFRACLAVDFEVVSARNLSSHWRVHMSGPDLSFEEVRMQELRAKRKALWGQFECNPNEIHLAAKLKVLDDQIAQSNQPSELDPDKMDDSEMSAFPEVRGLFLLLAVSRRGGTKPDSAQTPSRYPASEYASPGPSRLNGKFRAVKRLQQSSRAFRQEKIGSGCIQKIGK